MTTTGVACPPVILQFLDNAGRPAVNGTLLTQVGGVNAAVYQDLALTTPLPNPVPLNSRGEISTSNGVSSQLFLTPNTAYSFTLFDSLGNQLWSANYVNGIQAAVTQSTVGAALYPQTAAEIALGVTPTNFWYPGSDPYVDPRRYGADPTNNPATAAATTTAIQTAINVAYQNSTVGGNGIVWIGAGCKFRMNSVSLSMNASATAPLRIMGATQIGSALIATTGLATPLLTFTTSNPNVGPNQAFLQIQNLSLVSVTSPVAGGHGLALYGIAVVLLDNIRITQFDRNIDVQNVIDLTIRECSALQGNYGIKIGLYGTFTGGGYPTPNLIRIDNSIVNLNLIRGIEYNGGTGLFIRGCDIESNGTGINCTASPGSGATSATLTANWPYATGAYATVFSDQEVRTVNFTNGSSSITWSTGLTSSQSAPYINPTGGIFVLGQCSPDLLEGHVVIEDTWLESNQLNIFSAAQTNGCGMRITVRSCELIAAANGQEIVIAGCLYTLLQDLQSASVGDLYYVAGNAATLINVSAYTINTSGVSVPIYENVATSGGSLPWGRQDSATLTLTGTVTNPNVLTYFYQQGDEITALISDVQATSNTTGCSLVGIPSKYAPGGVYELPMIIEDNGTDSVQFGIIGSGGTTITLTKNGSSSGFTASGSKGPRRNILKWKTTI